ncbi:hypothetical protein [Nonomuraea sp. NPDC050783]|uniref:hypothetical protein n=1 Tax=Nonomuraea sp. NPDC050783 TaxID=3154634 RepID=UPI0034660EDE
MSSTDRRPLSRRITAVAAAALIPLGAAGVAWAATTDNMFPTAYTGSYCATGMGVGQPCQTDDREVYFYMDSSGEYELESPDRAAVNSAIDDEYRPTDLAFHYDSSPVFSGDGETDIIYQEGSTGLPSNLDGITWCNAKGHDNKDCDQQYIRIRGNGHYTHGLTCHETGHAVGLQHGDWASPQLSRTDTRLGCMVTPVGSNAGLGANNRENINATY